MSTTTTPTGRWRGPAAHLPSLDGPADIAEKLLLHVHFGVDWDSWIGARRSIYWSNLLPDRVVVATYRAATLNRWWCLTTEALESEPRTPDGCLEVAHLLAEPARPVLDILRNDTPALILRVRLIADAHRATRKAQQ